MPAIYQPEQSGQRWLPCTTASQVVGFSLLIVPVGSGMDGDGNLIVAAPSTGGLDPREMYANGPDNLDYTGVVGGRYGVCTKDWPAWVLYEHADGTPVVGEEWGPTADGSGTPLLHKGVEGFIVVGGTLDLRSGGAANDAVWVIPKHCAF
jgi:hypothetical protein